MKRRSFLMSLAGAIVVPVIHLRGSVSAEAIMGEFCDPDAVRYDISRPFTIDRLTYATDCHAMIRAELNAPEVESHIRVPRVDRVWSNFWDYADRDWVNLSDFSIEPTIANCGFCSECGCRRVEIPDDDVGKREVIEQMVKYDFDPDEWTVRDASCPKCHGLDDVSVPDVSVILGVRHYSFYLKRIAKIPDVKVCRVRHDSTALLFRGSGFEGVSLGLVEQ